MDCTIYSETRNKDESLFTPEKDCVALRYLVTGDAQIAIAANYRLSPAIVGRIISETCKAIWEELINKGFLDYPSSEHDWLKVAQKFEDRWNFPNALGTTDGKHVVMQAPARQHVQGLPFLITKKHTALF